MFPPSPGCSSWRPREDKSERELMAVAHWAAVKEAAVAVKVTGVTVQEPNARATSLARAGVGEAVNEPATTTNTPKVAGMRGNFMKEAPFNSRKRSRTKVECANEVGAAVSGKDCRCGVGASVGPKLGKGFGEFGR